MSKRSNAKRASNASYFDNLRAGKRFTARRMAAMIVPRNGIKVTKLDNAKRLLIQAAAEALAEEAAIKSKAGHSGPQCTGARMWRSFKSSADWTGFYERAKAMIVGVKAPQSMDMPAIDPRDLF